jgi:thiosulfate dehydrogenase
LPLPDGHRHRSTLYVQGRCYRQTAVETAYTMWRFLQGLIIGASLLPVALLVWLNTNRVPVAVGDRAIPYEQFLMNLPLGKRVQHELKTPSIKADESTLTSGAYIYGEKCSACHGLYGKPSTVAASMYPTPPELWHKQTGSDAVGVSNKSSGTIYWKVANGIRLSGMPAYQHDLTENEIWQVSLLLSNANKPLPPSAIAILRGKKSVCATEDAQESIAKAHTVVNN